MSNKLDRLIKATINELWDRGIDASMMQDELVNIIDDRQDYDPERDWQEIAEQLGLL